MKLRIKIFISIVTVSLTTLLASTIYVINQSHLANIEREQERSINEYELILSTIEDNMDFNTSKASLILLFSRYNEYYYSRGIELLLYQGQNPLYNTFPAINENKYKDLLNVEKGTKIAGVFQENHNQYFMVSGQLSTGNLILIYSRNIDEVYQSRTRNIQMTAIFAVGLILLISIMIYFYSKWIAKPIEVLEKGALALSGGDYQVRIPVTKDEFKELGNAFNIMASAVEDRTMELEARARDLQVFIDNLSHEMNTPLTSIQGYAEFLLNANSTEEQRRKAGDTIRQEAKRMKDIYSKLMTLTFAREHAADITEIKATSLCSEVEAVFLTQFKEQHIDLQKEILVETVVVDRILFHMLLSNLIKNSIQAMPKGGTILLKVYEFNEHTILEVSDQGTGIPQNKINEVTKPFYRVDKSRSRKTGGAGLGLSICKSIADLHNADFIIESEEGSGTTVKIVL